LLIGFWLPPTSRNHVVDGTRSFADSSPVRQFRVAKYPRDWRAEGVRMPDKSEKA
jgi:hypothetical protein